MQSAGQAQDELGAEIVVIKKSSPEYGREKYPPPCPSVLVNGRFIAKNETVTFETLKTAVMSDSDPA